MVSSFLQQQINELTPTVEPPPTPTPFDDDRVESGFPLYKRAPQITGVPSFSPDEGEKLASGVGSEFESISSSSTPYISMQSFIDQFGTMGSAQESGFLSSIKKDITNKFGIGTKFDIGTMGVASSGIGGLGMFPLIGPAASLGSAAYSMFAKPKFEEAVVQAALGTEGYSVGYTNQGQTVVLTPEGDVLGQAAQGLSASQKQTLIENLKQQAAQGQGKGKLGSLLQQYQVDPTSMQSQQFANIFLGKSGLLEGTSIGEDLKKSVTDQFYFDESGAEFVGEDTSTGPSLTSQLPSSADLSAQYEQQYGPEDQASDAPDDMTMGDYDPADPGGARFGGLLGKIKGSFVKGPPSKYAEGTTVADTVDTQVRENSFIMNAPMTEKLNKNNKLLDISNKKPKIKDKKNKGFVDVSLSKGEFVISPEETKRLTPKLLNFLNNQGKKEVALRQKKLKTQKSAKGGFLNFENGGNVNSDTNLKEGEAILDGKKILLYDTPAKIVNKFLSIADKKQTRTNIIKFLKGLNPTEAMTLALFTETPSNKTPLDNMKNIGSIILNRTKSQNKDFKDKNTVQDVLTHQTRGGALQFAGLEPTVLHKRLTGYL